MVKAGRIFLLTFFIGMQSLFAAHAQVEVSVELNPAEIPYYKPAFLTIEVVAPADREVTLPDLRPVLLESKLLDDKTAVADYAKEALEDGRIHITETYALDPVFVKDYTFDPITVTIGDESHTVPGPTLRVRELTEAEQIAVEQFDGGIVGGPTAVSRPVTERWEFWALLIVLSITLCVALAYWWRTRGQLKSLESPIDPWDQAILRLDALSERNLPKQGYYGSYYVDLSAILRYYIEGRFQLHAPERTTQEFLSEMMEGKLFDESQEVFLQSFLRLCDRVKFAKYQPGMIEMEESFVQVRKFIDETIPKPEPEVSEEDAA